LPLFVDFRAYLASRGTNPAAHWARNAQALTSTPDIGNNAIIGVSFTTFDQGKPMKKMTTIPAMAAAALMLGAVPRLCADAKDNWTTNCAACHGPDGAGHTKAGRMNRVKSMADPKYQQGFTDEQAAKRIKEGLKDPTGKERMKAFGDKFSDAEIADLVAYVRTFQK
jgi:mono/diheme cytochrome c family protein